MDEQVVEIIQQLIDWHQEQVNQLSLITNNDFTVVRVSDGKGGEIDVTDEKTIKGIKLGVEIALDQLGKLPISLNKE